MFLYIKADDLGVYLGLGWNKGKGEIRVRVEIGLGWIKGKAANRVRLQ